MKKILSSQNTAELTANKKTIIGESAAQPKLSRLAGLGVYGFDRSEPVILAALITEDPLLLIGPSGTGKTYLLNTLSEALGLNHRHYNASLISFDDLVGFPYPDKDNAGVKFLETPATVWGAQSVLIDEISRCKPEHQNRLFSLIHERRIQGIPLTKLRFRWAAMNPCSSDQGSIEDYAGSEALDPALADRFSLFVQAADWDELTKEERLLIAAPAGEGRVANDGGRLRDEVALWRKEFLSRLEDCPPIISTYVEAAITALSSGGARLSPRRSTLMTRSLFAATIAAGNQSESIFRRILQASLPQQCWGVAIKRETVAAAHRVAWASAQPDSPGIWLHSFMAEKNLARKLAILVEKCDSPDSGTQAVAELLASEAPERAAAFAFVTYPAAVAGKLPIGAEGVNDLGKAAAPFLTAKGDIVWQERKSTMTLKQAFVAAATQGKQTKHPDFVRYAAVLNNLEGGRAERAKQFFNGCLVRKYTVADPEGLEIEINQCVEVLTQRGLI